MQIEKNGNKDSNYDLIVNKLKFLLLIWKDGAFESEIDKKLGLSWREFLDNFVKSLNFERFISIDLIKNPKGNKDENFYSISKDNLKFIYNHICKSVKMDTNQNVFNFILEDSINISPNLTTDIEFRLIDNEEIDKEKLVFLLEKSISYFFIFIINLSPSIPLNKETSLFIRKAQNFIESQHQSQLDTKNKLELTNGLTNSQKFQIDEMDYFFRGISIDLLLIVLLILSNIALQINLLEPGINITFLITLNFFCKVGIVLVTSFYIIEFWYNKHSSDRDLKDIYMVAKVITLGWAGLFIVFLLINFIGLI